LGLIEVADIADGLDEGVVASRTDPAQLRLELGEGQPFMAPSITQGAIKASWVSPAANVCVRHLPKGAAP